MPYVPFQPRAHRDRCAAGPLAGHSVAMLLASLRFLASLAACTAFVFARAFVARPLARLVMSGRGHADRTQRRLVAAAPTQKRSSVPDRTPEANRG